MSDRSIPAGRCRDLIGGVLRSLGAEEFVASEWAQLLVETSLLGFDSHGIRMLERYVQHIQGGGIRLDAVPKQVSRIGSCVVMDAGAGLGHLAAREALNVAIDTARDSGISCVSVRHSNHIGACGIYTRRAAVADCIGICSTISGAGMAPWGGKQPLIGSNPISIAAPIEGKPPFLFDAATTTVAMGHITKALDLGEPIPDNWALDSDGKPTTDPKKAREGSLLPMAGHKGYGLALGVEILCALLSGGPFCTEVRSWIRQTERPMDASFAMIVIRVDAFQEVARFRARMRELVETITSSPRRPGVDRIYYPGEREGELFEQRGREGIPVDETDLAMLARMADRAGLDWEQVIRA